MKKDIKIGIDRGKLEPGQKMKDRHDRLVVSVAGRKHYFHMLNLREAADYLLSLPDVKRRYKVIVEDLSYPERRWIKIELGDLLAAKEAGMSLFEWRSRQYAKMTGKKGGKAKSDAKTLAARLNAKKHPKPGSRPRGRPKKDAAVEPSVPKPPSLPKKKSTKVPTGIDTLNDGSQTERVHGIEGVSPALGATFPVPLILVPGATSDATVDPKTEEWDGSRPGDRQLIRGTRWKLFGKNFLHWPSLRSGYFLSDKDIALRNSIRSRKAAASRVGRTYDGPEFKVTDEEIKLMPRYKRLKKLYIEEWGEYDES